MLGNAAIVRFLEEKGVANVFHLPGVHTLPLNCALAGSNIKVIIGRHESAAGFMADGFSRAAGETAVLLVTRVRASATLRPPAWKPTPMTCPC